MSTFRVAITKIRAIEPIQGSDFIELAVVGDYRSVVKKGQFVPGALCAYIAEGSVVPQELLKEIGLEGKLAGAQKNRVKAVVLRGHLSQGICIEVKDGWTEGQDVAEILGITKYHPPIPVNMSGQVEYVGRENTFHYDIDNVKNFEPGTIIHFGEQVVFTEKIHGTLTAVGVLPQDETVLDPRLIVGSKEVFHQGLSFKQIPENQFNIYCRVAKHWEIQDRILKSSLWGDGKDPVYVFGETFGMQDLRYGASLNADETLGFRVFDIFVGLPMVGSFLNDADLDAKCLELRLNRVPILYRGPFSREIMLEYTVGTETVSGTGLHMREGIVIKPVKERKISFPHLPMSRVQLKSVSEVYSARHGKNKHVEVTEYE